MNTLLTSAAIIALAVATAPSLAQDDAPRFGGFGFDISGMNADIDPGDDFFRYANDAWLARTEIPSDRSNFGMFTQLHIEAQDHVRAIIDAAAAQDAAPGSNSQLVGDLFASWMDAETINARGLTPALPYLEQINAAGSWSEIAALFATVHYESPWSIGVIPDPADPTQYTLYMQQDGLGLPDRDYYFEEDEASQGYRAAYLEYIAHIFDLAGIEGGDEKAEAIMAFETALAEAHWTQERTREITEIYNELSLADLEALAPQFNWTANLDAFGLGGRDHFIVATPSAIAEAGALFEAADIALLQDYLTFHFLSSHASRLPEAFDQARFDFYSRTLNGIESQRERGERGVELVGGALGHAIGQIYVDRHFPPASKAQMEELVGGLQTAFRGRLETLAWMDEETRVQALDKLSTFEPRIGYPDIWDDYDGLQIRADDYFGNRMRMAEFQWAEQLEDLAGPVDRREWDWPPQVVNASYNPLLNQITFPAGILQAPFFDPNADPAINFGGIGAVIGHEIGHGFDDQGRRFDAQGRIRDWWSEETNARFLERSNVLVEQYDQYSPLEGYTVNGRLSLGENIGDLGGLEMAYSAWRAYVDEHYGGQAPVIDGFTGDQRFFLGWAQVWRNLYRDDAMITRLRVAPHSPAEFRVNGVVRNMDAWYAAFEVDQSDALYLPPEERVSIW
jgi:endothelin-converting enzyme/putative endopeptidase